MSLIVLCWVSLVMVSIFNHRFVKRPEKIAFEKQMEQQWNEMF
ncbi:hypothetical protein O9993_11475 [Vibrio lentus]|nr:hypothetical protein [Vibrio lentus]